MSSRLSASPHGKGILSRSSPPVGSMPKWVQATKFHKRCLSDRNKLGIGCSEVGYLVKEENQYSERK
ncbi:hypothetical protein H6P81_003288 [Aristolochia fimbriata]|uniref:Ribosomal protein S12 n=1 Tax=Aristolochia fimbriata TaxID=158543 RepID=A0AAV7FC52_ARIFI|nr:hypothetical protein H6P81_003288 [Aristolochia fimbriata]